MTHSLTHPGLARRGVRFHWPIALSIALGVAIATAVITGALVVGDSMRASLRALTIDRLGRIDQVVIPGVFFSVEPLPESANGREIHPVILFDRAVVEAGQGSEVKRAGSVQVIGIEPRFWELEANPLAEPIEIGDDEIVLNQAVADELGVQVGDEVTVRLPAEQAVPADSPLGRRDAQTEGIPRLRVKAIIENRGLGRFALQPNQAEPMTALLRRETIAETLQRDGQANVLLVTASDQSTTADAAGSEQTDAWLDQLSLGLDDFGLRLERHRQVFEAPGQPPQVVFDYYSITSDQLLLPPPAVEAIRSRFPDANAIPMMTYLANAIERIDPETGEVTASVPYSTITAVDSHAVLPLSYKLPAGESSTAADSGTVSDPDSADAPVPIALNSWAAEALSAEVGDALRIAYFEPEVEGGKEIERFFSGVLTDIVPITRPVQPYRRTRPAVFDQLPTIYNDPHLTPSVPGVTDQDSISDWDLPFPLEREISSEDDRYWNEHRLTPKAFLPLADGQRLFGSRFGDTTSLRIEAAAVPDEQRLQNDLLAALVTEREQLGWTPIPIRAAARSVARDDTV